MVEYNDSYSETAMRPSYLFRKMSSDPKSAKKFWGSLDDKVEKASTVIKEENGN